MESYSIMSDETRQSPSLPSDQLISQPDKPSQRQSLSQPLNQPIHNKIFQIQNHLVGQSARQAASEGGNSTNWSFSQSVKQLHVLRP